MNRRFSILSVIFESRVSDIVSVTRWPRESKSKMKGGYYRCSDDLPGIGSAWEQSDADEVRGSAWGSDASCSCEMCEYLFLVFEIALGD